MSEKTETVTLELFPKLEELLHEREEVSQTSSLLAGKVWSVLHWAKAQGMLSNHHAMLPALEEILNDPRCHREHLKITSQERLEEVFEEARNDLARHLLELSESGFMTGSEDRLWDFVGAWNDPLDECCGEGRGMMF